MVAKILGFASENAAHRIAVSWRNDANQVFEGVYIPRRDSDSPLVNFAGGRLFPGEHHKAKFQIIERRQSVELHAHALDQSVSIDLLARDSDLFPETSVFSSLNDASEFFRCGSQGYSETKNSCYLDGMELVTDRWEVKPLDVEFVHSSFFADETIFPKDKVEFDCALILRNIQHEWHSIPGLTVESRRNSKTQEIVFAKRD